VSTEPKRSNRFLEVIAVLLLGITTIGTAWCGYQASQWNGEQGDLARASSDQRVEANRLFGLATQKTSYDASVIAQYAEIYRSGDTALLDFFKKTLIRPDFLPTLESWETQVRAGGVPTSLFSDQAYLDSQFGGYQEAAAKSEASGVASQEAGDTANQYVVTTILLAIALFFAGVTSSFQFTPARVFLLILGFGTLAVAGSRLTELPVIW
jgi:hypothetical protein